MRPQSYRMIALYHHERANTRKIEILYSRIYALFTQHLIFPGSTPVRFAELADKIRYRMKTAGTADLLKGQRCILHQPERDLQPVADQRLHGRTFHIGVKTAPRLAAADVCRFCNVFKRDRLCILFPNKGEHLLDADLRSDLNARIF